MIVYGTTVEGQVRKYIRGSCPRDISTLAVVNFLKAVHEDVRDERLSELVSIS